MDNFLSPPPLPVDSASALDAHFYNAVITLTDEQTSGYVAVDGLTNLRCRVYPLDNTRDVAMFATDRNYTDKIRLDGYYPRANSSHFGDVTDQSGEQFAVDVRAIDEDGDTEHTTLLVKRQFDRA